MNKIPPVVASPFEGFPDNWSNGEPMFFFYSCDAYYLSNIIKSREIEPIYSSTYQENLVCLNIGAIPVFQCDNEGSHFHSIPVMFILKPAATSDFTKILPFNSEGIKGDRTVNHYYAYLLDLCRPYGINKEPHELHTNKPIILTKETLEAVIMPASLAESKTVINFINNEIGAKIIQIGNYGV